jgi:beta-lactamase regulating signal transducer with metallopeptidase domain
MGIHPENAPGPQGRPFLTSETFKKVLLMNPLIHALCWTLLHSLWEGLVLALVAGTVMILSRKSSATYRYNLLCGLLLLFVITIGYTFYYQLHTADTGTANAANTATSANATNAANTATSANAPNATNALTTATSANAAHAANTAAHQPTAPSGAAPGSGFWAVRPIQVFVDYFNTHASVVVLVWFIFFMGRFVQMLSALVKAQRIRHYGHSPVPAEWEQKLGALMNRLQIYLPVRLLESTQIKVPVVMGYLKPIILLPIGLLNHLSTEEVESILLHELAHIRRRDYVINLIQGLLDTLFFFNPALLWVSSLIRLERENCCDDMAIRQTGSRQQFVEALVSFYAYTNPAPNQFALAFAAKESQLVSRVKRIVYKKNRTLNPMERGVLLGTLLLMGVSFTILAWTNAPDPTTRMEKMGYPGTGVSATQHMQTGNAQPNTLAEASPQPKAAPHPDTWATILPHVGRDTIPASTKDSTEVAEDDETAGKDPKSKDDDDPLVETPTKWKNLGYADHMHLNFLLALSEHGVTPSYVEDLKNLGYAKITLEEALDYHDHGVNPSNIETFNKFSGKHLTLDEVEEYIDHGVTVEYVQEMRQLSGKPITIEQAVEYRDHGVTKEFIKSFVPLGYNLSLDKAEELVDHGVSADYIRRVKAQGLKNLTLEQYERLHDAGFND